MIQRFQQAALITWSKKVAATISPTVTSVWQSSRAPQPDLPYISMDVISGPVKIGHDELRVNPSTGKTESAGMRYYTVSINAHGDTANAIASELQSSLELPSIQEELRKSGIAVVDIGDVRALDKLDETDWEGRAQFDFQFAVSKNKVDDDSGNIEKVELTNELYPNDYTVVVNE